VDTKTLPQPTTRVARGIALGIARFEQIERTAPWRWSVPSESDVERFYVVDLKTATCPCADRTPAGETDKHVVAARYVKGRTATCAGCRRRIRHRDLTEVLEDHESLTWFVGDLLCYSCLHDHGGIA
jgi:hypothetical protein